MKIKWLKSRGDDGTYDLCGKFNGKYVDIIQRYDNTWSISFNNVTIENNITNRKLAKEKIIKFLEK